MEEEEDEDEEERRGGRGGRVECEVRAIVMRILIVQGARNEFFGVVFERWLWS